MILSNTLIYLNKCCLFITQQSVTEMATHFSAVHTLQHVSKIIYPLTLTHPYVLLLQSLVLAIFPYVLLQVWRHAVIQNHFVCCNVIIALH